LEEKGATIDKVWYTTILGELFKILKVNYSSEQF
jgi:hypothetical protein